MLLERAEISLQIDEAEWSLLRSHLHRGGIILVNDAFDLADAACKVANDEVTEIKKLMETGMIGKPSDEKIRLWESEQSKKFAMLIVSPFVLIQEKMPTFH